MEGKLNDIRSKVIEIIIRRDGKVVWVNDEFGQCVLRACGVEEIVIQDDRRRR